MLSARAKWWWGFQVGALEACVGALLMLALNGCVAPAPRPPPVTKPIDTNRFCAVSMGYQGAAWSGGMKQLATELRAQGIDARVYEWTQSAQAAADSRGANDVTLAVHSFGGKFADDFARAIYPRRIRVVYALEPTVPGRNSDFPVDNPPDKPRNVDRYVEIYVVPQTPFTIHAGPRVRGSEPGTTGVFHTQLDDDPTLRKLGVDLIVGG